MSRFFIFSSVLYLLLSFASCDNNLPILNTQSSSQQVLETRSLVSSTDTIYKTNRFIYNGETYNYVSTIVNDSIVNISNDTVKNIFLELEQYPNTVTHMYMDGTVEIFRDNETFHVQLSRVLEREETLVNNMGSKEELLESEINPCKADVPWTAFPPIDRSDNKIANLYLCDDEDYEDTYKQYDLRSGESSLEVKQLKSDGLNDKTTSFAAYTIGGTTLFELFEDSNFKDDCFSFVVYKNSATEIRGGVTFKWGAPTPQIGQFLVADLKDLWVKGHKSDTWNDRISSVRITRL